MTTAVCVHHWMLEDGIRDVPGRCVRCGTSRVFAGAGSIGDALRETTGPYRAVPMTVSETRRRAAARQSGATAAARASRKGAE